jgi:hypothetical protein
MAAKALEFVEGATYAREQGARELNARERRNTNLS